MPRYVIVGGTSAIAEHCARLWLEREPLELWLIGRQELPTKAVANDLKIRSPESTIYIESCSFTEAVEIYALVSRITKSGPIDRVLIAHGSLPDQIKCQNDLKSVRGSSKSTAFRRYYLLKPLQQRCSTRNLARSP